MSIVALVLIFDKENRANIQLMGQINMVTTSCCRVAIVPWGTSFCHIPMKICHQTMTYGGLTRVWPSYNPG